MALWRKKKVRLVVWYSTNWTSNYYKLNRYGIELLYFDYLAYVHNFFRFLEDGLSQSPADNKRSDYNKKIMAFHKIPARCQPIAQTFPYRVI